jgi:hypothetical protein
VTSSKVKEDAGFSEFDRAIGEMARAEESGSDEEELARYQEEVEKAVKAEKVHDD